MPLKRLAPYLRLLRLNQTYKLLVVWLPALFHGGGAVRTEAPLLAHITAAWFLASGIVYTLNDLMDRREDLGLAHARNRPIATGAIGVRAAAVFLTLLVVLLGACTMGLPSLLKLQFALYLAINLGYSLGLKRFVGVRQLIVAVGFWLRLKSGASPVTAIPLTVWASMFTLGLAYHLGGLKGLARLDGNDPSARTVQLSAALLAGALSLVALASVCIARGLAGTLRFPEFPPMLCLLGMHRGLHRALSASPGDDQARVLLGDPVIWVAMGLFVAVFLVS